MYKDAYHIASILLLDLPSKVRGFTVPNDDGTFTICLNAHHTLEMHQQTVLHEMEHIGRNDFGGGSQNVNKLELLRHEAVI